MKKEKIYEAVQKVSFDKNDSLSYRCETLIESLVACGINESDIIYAGEKPCVGRCLGVKVMKDRVRINYRCGYGRYNYAPCIEIIL